MSDNNVSSELPIREDDLAHFKKRAGELLKVVEWEPKGSLAALRRDSGPKPTTPALLPRETIGPKREKMSIVEVARSINQGDDLFDEGFNESLVAVRRGLQIALHVAVLYSKSSGLESLRERNEKKQLTSVEEQAEFRSKNETFAAITLFVLSYYVIWKLQQKGTDELSSVNLPFNGLPETIPLTGQMTALQCTLFHFGTYLKDGGVLTGVDCLKMTQMYFGAVLEEIKGRSEGLKHATPYTERSYRLERTTFCVNGFHGDTYGSAKAVEFRRVELSSIVGNHDAKRHSFRIAQAMIAYDFEAKKNPLVELGGFPWVYLMKGIPGTGKTLLIAAVLTLIDDYCKSLGIPFRPHPFPNSIVSTFQGGSAEHMENWMLPLSNPRELIVAPVDDAENSFQDRTMQGVSSGVREVIGVFLRRTEGASAILRGNSLIMFATNIPEQLDRAVLSRVLARMDVDGARTREDFLDQMRMWTEGYDKYQKGFVDLSWPENYEFLSAQRFRRAADRIAEGAIVVRDQKLAGILEELCRTHQKNTHEFYAALFVRLKKEFPFFSSRDVRNIQTAVGTRLLDFDFPEEWLTKRDAFVGLSYDKKKEMIVDLMKENMRGLTFHELLYQELVRYLDTMVTILDAARRRRVQEYVDEIGIRKEADQLTRN